VHLFSGHWSEIQGFGYGAKMFVTNGERGDVFAILAKTNPPAQPPHRGISAFIVEKGLLGVRVGRTIKPLGTI